LETGTKISAVGHVGLLGWLVFGSVFRAEPVPVNIQEVSVITSDQFAALTAPVSAPEVTTDVALPQPTEEEPAPEVVEPPEPEALETPAVPAPPAPAEPEPEPEVAAEDPPAPEPQPEPVPEESPEPVPQQADRVAEEAVEEPEPDAAPAEETQEAIDEGEADIPAEEPQDATAPEEATTELVTEADEQPTAPQQSLRPPSNRPQRTAQAEPVEDAPEAPAEQPTEEPSVADDVAAAVAAAQEDPAPTAAPTGPPLTGSELEGLRVSVSSCWNVGALSTEAQETQVTVYVARGRDGKPDTSSIRMLSSSGGSEGAARRVFETARRAIIRCGARGFPLPVEKYGQWQEIEMTFNPEGMFWR